MAAAEQSTSVVIEPAPLASQLAPESNVTYSAIGGGGNGDGEVGGCGPLLEQMHVLKLLQLPVFEPAELNIT